MKQIAECDTIQIEITSACVLKCSNCTRFCGHHVHPNFIKTHEFTKAIDSLQGFVQETNGIIGFMGGEPLLHPKFEEFCDYALTKIPRSNLGLWSTFPAKFAHLAPVVGRTFGNLLLNDHSRGDIFHAPLLQASEDYYPDPADLFRATEHCWVQETWSASVNSKGAWFCEVAGALSELFDGPEGWDVAPAWWKRTTKDFQTQREWACKLCGGALPFVRRKSVDGRDDVSEGNLERLKAIKSRKLAQVVVHPKATFDPALFQSTYPNQTYKDETYRKGIATRYGLGLKLNSRGYWEPFSLGSIPSPQPSLFKTLSSVYTSLEVTSDGKS